MSRRIVVALGGNALGKNLAGQMREVKTTARSIADLIEAGDQVIITHGNGPQVGMIHNAFGAYKESEPEADIMPLSMCVAMSQGYIGYDLQNALRQELRTRGILDKSVATVLSQTIVDKDDKAFLNPTKPIGPFYSEEMARILAEKKGYTFKEDSGRGWRQVVASPRPVEIVEIECIRTLVDGGHVVIASGGGGIPVYRDGEALRGAAAVVDKDFASAKLASQLKADMLIILTAVERVALHFGKPEQVNLDTVTVDEMRSYIDEGHFGAGSMLPKVQACVEFVSGGEGRTAVIAHLEKASEAIAGRSGTRIIP